ncbi:hypothetical protein PQR75_00730 [Paraburkholderia fungorum]|uniref:hypothetical protein n=1 Tax=Paraburkholderia fungorum TaxID=134537 RepID=UPI0038BCACFB
MQIDFGQAWVSIAGERIKVYARTKGKDESGGTMRVTRGLVHTELRKLGPALKDPVVRDAFHDVRAEQMALKTEVYRGGMIDFARRFAMPLGETAGTVSAERPLCCGRKKRRRPPHEHASRVR